MTRYRGEKPDIVTCDTISGHFVTDIGETADIGGGNNPDGTQAVRYLSEIKSNLKGHRVSESVTLRDQESSPGRRLGCGAVDSEFRAGNLNAACAVTVGAGWRGLGGLQASARACCRQGSRLARL